MRPRRYTRKTEDVFFFEKKNQKTFTRAAGIGFPKGDRLPAVTRTRFLVLFFKKEHPSFLSARNFCAVHHLRLISALMPHM